MKKWPLLYAAFAVVLAGCAGGGDGVVNGGGGGGGGGRDVSTVNLVASSTIPPGLIDMYILPGQGRAPGSKTATIHTTDFFNDSGATTRFSGQLPPDTLIVLDQFNVYNRPISENNGAPQITYPPSVLFDSLDIEFKEMTEEDDFGGITTSPTEFDKISHGFLLTTLRGRVSALQLKMHDAMFVNSAGPGTLDFDVNRFIFENTNPETGKITSFFSDLVDFDISAVPNKPKLESPSVAGQDAFHVYLGGDFYALSQKNAKGVAGSAGEFEILTKFGTFEGFFRPQDSTTLLKTYELKQADPSQIPPLRLITALKGKYRSVNEVTSNLKDFEFITFPKTGDGAKQEITVLQRTGGTITNMWFGTADYSTKTFRVYPIKNLQPASTAGELRGNLVGFADTNGNAVASSGANWWQNVREGTFAFTGAPAGIPAANRTGRFLVFRAK